MKSGTEASWHKGWDIQDHERERYRQRSIASQQAKKDALSDKGEEPNHPIYSPRLLPEELMPISASTGLTCLSLFSGGGGLDLGFDRAGYQHVASYELLDFAGKTLNFNKPNWDGFSGHD